MAVLPLDRYFTPSDPDNFAEIGLALVPANAVTDFEFSGLFAGYRIVRSNRPRLYARPLRSVILLLQNHPDDGDQSGDDADLNPQVSDPLPDVHFHFVFAFSSTLLAGLFL